jgi:hypothetical protein
MQMPIFFHVCPVNAKEKVVVSVIKPINHSKRVQGAEGERGNVKKILFASALKVSLN